MSAKTYDLLLTNGHVLTMDVRGTQFEPGFVACQGTVITAIGPMQECPAVSEATSVIDCAGCVVLPGLINCHTHLPMAYFRGLADDLPLKRWLEDHIWPAEQRYLSPELVYEATRFAVAECLKSGVTCINDMYLFADSVAQACADSGMRAYVGEGVIGFPTASAPAWQDGKRISEELIAKYTGHPLVTPTVCAHAPYSCSPELLITMHALAEKHELLFQTHLHESENEPDYIDWGKQDESPTHSLKRIGVLGPRMIAVHCVWISDHDIHHMRELDCGVAHCPTSNMKLGNGVAPVHSMIEGEIPVGIGTDGAASNNNLNLIEEIHLAAVSAKAVYKNPEVVPAQIAMTFATSRAAQLLHNPRLGVLAAGNHADITVVQMGSLYQVPRFHHADAIYSQLVYATQGSDVRDTIVAGKVLLRDRKLTQMDEAELKAKAQSWIDKNFPA